MIRRRVGPLAAQISGMASSVFCWILAWLTPGKIQAEDHADYRFEFYKEEDGRIEVNTHSVFFAKELIANLSARGSATYDSISGATPTGAKVAPGSNHLITQRMQETRWAGSLALDARWAAQTITPQFAYSTESDYESLGISLNDAIEFNEKNTTLQLGVAHNFDQVLDNKSPRRYQDKDTTQGLIGLSQLLGPSTVLLANFTYGYESGYLNDPYRKATFDTFGFAFPERRPDNKDQQIFLVSLLQNIASLDASIEGEYRFYHDSFGIYGHTGTLNWRQRLGKHLLLQPTFRFYKQTAADFYGASFPGITPPPKGYFSADYRLSELYTVTYGLEATIFLTDWLRMTAGYHRYEMYGLDGKTSSLMYPKANIFSAGLQVWF